MIGYSELMPLVSQGAGLSEGHTRRLANYLAGECLFLVAPIGRPPLVAAAGDEAAIGLGHLVNLLLALTAPKSPTSPAHVRAIRRLVPVNDSHSRQWLRGDTCGDALENFLTDWRSGTNMPLDIEVQRIGNKLPTVVLLGSVGGRQMCQYVPPSKEDNLPRAPDGAIVEIQNIRTPLIELFAAVWHENQKVVAQAEDRRAA